MRKWLKRLAVFGLVVFAGLIIVRLFDEPKTQTTPPVVTPITAGPPAPPVVPLPSVTGKSAVGDQQDAVNAAASAISNMATASLQTPAQIKAMLAVTVVPEERAAYQQHILDNGDEFIAVTHYANTALAGEDASYSVQALAYKVDQYDGQNAVIRLFTVSHWVTVEQFEYHIPAITSVVLRFVDGNWLYVSNNIVPTSVPSNETYAQTVRDLQPYLKGFTGYGQDTASS